MSYVSKNYRESGDKTVIGGELAIIGPGKITKDGADISLGGSSSVTSNDITDASTVGKLVLTAADAAGARSSIGAGTPYSLPTATSTTLGGVKKAAHVDPTTATSEQIANAMIAAGLMS
jgi:hypothetical protein